MTAIEQAKIWNVVSERMYDCADRASGNESTLLAMLAVFSDEISNAYREAGRKAEK